MSLCILDLVLIGYVSFFIYEGPRQNWIILALLGALLVVANAYLGFQIRYSYRVHKLMGVVHSKRFKSKAFLPKGEPSDRVYKAVRALLKKEKIFYNLDATKFRIPELGAYKHNLRLKKLGMRVIIKAGSVKQSRSGTLLLVPEGASEDSMEDMMARFDSAFGDGAAK